MRNFLVALFVAGLVVAPTFGAATINVEIRVTPATIASGQTATVEGWYTSPAPNGLLSIGGNVTAVPTGATATVGSLVPATFYVADFQGFQPGQPQAIAPAAPTAGTNGAVNGIGSAQAGSVGQTAGWDVTFCNTAKKLFSYTVTATATGATPGTIVFSWQDAGNPGFNGWYTTNTANPANDGVLGNVAATLTVNPAQPTNVTLVSTFPAQNATYKCGIMNRTARNVMELIFDGNLPTTLPTPGTQVKVYEMAAGAAGTVTGADLSANFDISLLNPTTLKLKQKVGAPALTDRKWYVVQITGWTGVTNTTTAAKFGLRIGDGDRGGRTQNADVTAALSKVSLTNRTDESPEGAYDFDGSGRVQNGDVTSALSFVSLTALPVAPW